MSPQLLWERRPWTQCPKNRNDRCQRWQDSNHGESQFRNNARRGALFQIPIVHTRFNAEATCVEEVKTRLAVARDRLGSLATLWRSRTLSIESKTRLIRTLNVNLADSDIRSGSLDLEQGIDEKHRGIWKQCYRRVLRILYTEHVFNVEVLLDRMGQRRMLLGIIRERKLKYFGHVTRHDSLEKDVMIGPMAGLRRQGGQRRQWLEDLCDRTDMSLTQLVWAAESRTLVHTPFYARTTGTVH